MQEASGETTTNLIHLPHSIQTLYDNEFQNRFQGETAQSMFERLSRIFEESDVNNYIITFTFNFVHQCLYIITILTVLLLESRQTQLCACE